MHVAQQLKREYFECRIQTEPVLPEQIFGGWQPHDRFGLVIDEPLGGLGASLLHQLAITQFYECKPERRGAGACYPEFYIIHKGGPHGDFSHFDVWPPRKELHVPDDDPRALLETINGCGITVLALPEGGSGDLAELEQGPSSWAEQGSFRDRVRRSFLYSPSGRVKDPDIELRSATPQVRENIEGTLDIMASVRSVRERVSASGAVTSGVMGDADDLRWGEIVETRLTEISASDIERARSALQTCFDPKSDVLVQSYVSLTQPESLARIAERR